MIKIKRILLATLIALISLSIAAVSAEIDGIGVWLDDEDTAEGDSAGTWSYVKCWATENGYSSISHDYDNWIVNNYFYSVRYTATYPKTYPSGSSASIGTDMWTKAKADVYAWEIPMWVTDNYSYSYASIDG